MCGIVAGVHWKKSAGNANDWVKEQFSDQINRGKDGFGMALFGKNQPVLLRRGTHVADAFVSLRLDEAPGILFHHRYPTSTPNLTWQTHPIFVSNEELASDWYFVHNGIISNDDELYPIHVGEGYEYTTAYEESSKVMTKVTKFNDSETLAVEVVRMLEGKIEKVRAEGSAAWVALEVNKTTKKATALHWGRNAGNPLYVNLDRKAGTLHMASENWYGTQATVDMASTMDLETHEVVERPLKVPEREYKYVSEYSGYKGKDGKTWWEREEEAEAQKKLEAEKKDKQAKESKYAVADKGVKEALEEAKRLDKENETGDLTYEQFEALKLHAVEQVELAFDGLERCLTLAMEVDDKDMKEAMDTAIPAVVQSIKMAKRVITASVAESEAGFSIEKDGIEVGTA